MKQLEKKDLVDGEIYVQKWSTYNYIFKLINLEKGIAINHKNYFDHWIPQLNRNKKIIEATPEEKHWLEVCIAANSFISYKEAMKTFIPEYVEYINTTDTSWKFGKIYKVDEDGKVNFESGSTPFDNHYTTDITLFKPSTKEAYDAQFVVKEPEFVLPEKWCVKVTYENLNIISNYLVKNSKNYINYRTTWLLYENRYFHSESHGSGGGHSSLNVYKGFTEITFEQFKKYVLKEQLEEPKDKVLTTLQGKILEVESSEGAIYQLGDKVTIFNQNSKNNGKVLIIQSFKWNLNKTKIVIIAQNTTRYGIGLDKIELYSEPIKITNLEALASMMIDLPKELSLLEQAKLKYPVGTKVKSLYTNAICTITKQSHLNYINSDGYCKNTDSIWFTASPYSPLIYRKGQWAEIIEDFKLPETWWITVENERQLEIAKQYFSQFMEFMNRFNHIDRNTIGIVNCEYSNKEYLFNLSTNTKSRNPQITFEQFEQHVLHNGFKVGDVIGNGNHIIYDLQYINGHSVAFYKYAGSGNTNAQCRILTKNIVK